MSNNGRLSAEERRQAIADAVREVFAAKGFDGTTTRELAKAAGVSEALLYKHFPSKESLYVAMLDACIKGPTFAEFKRILTLDPSTSTLVFMVHFVVSRFVQGSAGGGLQSFETSFGRANRLVCIIGRGGQGAGD